MPTFCQIVSLNNTFANNSKNEILKNYPQTLEKGVYRPSKFRYITFISSNKAFIVISRKWSREKKRLQKKTSKGEFLNFVQRRLVYFHFPCCYFFFISFRRYTWLKDLLLLKLKSISKLCKIYVKFLCSNSTLLRPFMNCIYSVLSGQYLCFRLSKSLEPLD